MPGTGQSTSGGGELSGSGPELVQELRLTLDRARELVKELETRLQHLTGEAPPPPALPQAKELEGRLARAESDIQELAAQLASSERQISRLMNLYVATYQLYATLTPSEVQDTIAEIAINLLGAEKFVLLLKRDDGSGFEVSLARGVAAGTDPLYSAELYPGGDPAVDETLRDGLLRLAPLPNSQAVAVVPLKVQGEIVGALVLLKLLSHKPSLRPEDRELLDLLSAHAASALFAARLFAHKDRRLRTLESLVKLARGE